MQVAPSSWKPSRNTPPCESPHMTSSAASHPHASRTLLSLLLLATLGATRADDWALAERIVAGIRTPDIPPATFRIPDYGAAPDGKSDSLTAIREAIADASRLGGGRVVVPRGKWFVKGPIHLRSRIELHLAEGAELIFGESPEDYLPVVLTRWDGTLCYNHSPLIYAAHVSDVAITGDGIINGNATHGFGTWRERQKPDQVRLRKIGNDLVPVHERIFGKGHHLRPSFIQFFGCKRVLVEGVTLRNSPFWCLHPVFCSDVTVTLMKTLL